ncbi:hypothetical protein DYBT9275_00549 [Dyadobacter sp. CECT 9275]|uniref:Uncharacterized protein n=1 Tax=Dyadobacter helix TaxID=2822344 RepID=A0A916J9N2_9BACT|nr:hypothetical protein [Dyadobacter sp. CECT 9275]CAG4990526.1 hypothetical protein DYBT9275_00549 [Dyadobacter sp. CECT 9275]
MKNQLHQSLTILMAFLILLSSTGFGFIEHQCMMRGKSMQLIAEKKPDSCEKKVVSTCCAASKRQKEASGTFFKKTDCCKEQQKYEKVDVTSSAVTQLLAKVLKVLAGGFVWTAPSFSFIEQYWEASLLSVRRNVISFTSLFHGRSMLFFIQSFLI